MAIHIALALALVQTLALSGVLWRWAQHVAGAKLLIVFLLGVGVWIVGNELPNWAGIGTASLAMALLATVPVTSAAFFHFCAIFTGQRLKAWVFRLAYGAAGLATALSLWISPGAFEHFEPFTGVQWVVVPNAAGWTTSLVWTACAGAGLIVLAKAFWQTQVPTERRQIAAVAISCGWGLMCISGYAFAALRIPQYPWQVLAFPAYPLILVYGILRYRVFMANAWARRALAWAILLFLGLLAVPLTLLLPVESRWLTSAVVAATCLAWSGPVRRLAERLVYPGGTPTAQDLGSWRSTLCTAQSLDHLSSIAASLLSQRMGVTVRVVVGPLLSDDPHTPSVHCRKEGAHWQVQLQGFEQAPPGQRHLAELFGTVLVHAAEQVETAAAAEQRERERQLQARLAELGSLAATVAHDLRNPLNVIAMATAFSPVEVRKDVQEQIARISRLAEDLLDYAKPWQIQPKEIDLSQHIWQAVRHAPYIELGPGLNAPCTLYADPARLDQVLTNLITNAHAAAGQRRVQVDTEPGQDGRLRIHVCDDGPGIPADLRERLFQPFASRSPGGTGLGLAIAARIMAAHGGKVELTERPPWRTCFTLTFPSGPRP
ncbi:sensor histidine kinase [Paracidovorax valerianellae]|uniref:histidine kinase n=1 Tax=Paracidovorax valerianellae TaxID=187868 RepID=A0A1G6ZH47_9BURK|nr:sensor histidine kinase [Paracidovorax valerianellae]MDA8444314.1 ATP-binding protein [Paracidovorax valerianellae]SDE02024.1 Signal transduction histidine kinase [Paracidovorax valerianellae]